MKKKLHRWSCLTSAFAWAADMNELAIHKYLEHDGSEIIDADAPEPGGRRGFHIQELTGLSIYLGKSLTPFQIVPQSTIGSKTFQVGSVNARMCVFMQHIIQKRGIIICQTMMGYDHALGFDKSMIFNPDDGAIFKVRMGDNTMQKVFRDFHQRINDQYKLTPRELWVYAG